MGWIGYVAAVLLICSRTSAGRRQDSEKPNTVNQTQTQVKNEVTTHIPSTADEPYFDMSDIRNVSSIVGETSHLHCTVRNLGNKTVSWIRKNDLHILTVGVITYTRDERISSHHRISSDKWTLKIRNTQMRDMGEYVCHVNTDSKMQTTVALVVEVPPKLTSQGPSDMVVREGANVSLSCSATGIPPPQIFWRREDGGDIIRDGRKATIVEGSNLELPKISRLNTGDYLCIASNGIPPSTSNKFSIEVLFPPMFWIPSQLEAAHQGQDVTSQLEAAHQGQNVTLECHFEAFPKAINYWVNNQGAMLVSDHKYQEVSVQSAYKVHMKLHIRNVTKDDYMEYRCVAQNSLGNSDGSITIYENPKGVNQTQTHLQEVEQITKTTVKNEVTTITPPTTELGSDNMAIQSSGEPYFDRSVVWNVSSVVGQTSHLHCTVRNAGNKTVSWIRKNDQHLLTVGRYTYTSDDRISSHHRISSDTWTLKIRNTQMSDMGEYWCEISAKSKLKMTFFLMVEVCCDTDPNLPPHLRTTQSPHRRTTRHPPFRTTQLRPLRTNELPPALQDRMTITCVTPHQVHLATSTTLDINLPLETLSTLPAQFLCQFKGHGKTLSSNATKTTTGVSCNTPSPHLLPSIPHGKTHFVAELSVIHADGSNIGIKPFENLSFYDCSAHSSCGSCVSSLFQCDWCVEGHRCTNDAAANCRTDTYVTDIKRIGGGIRSRPGPGFCPSISPIQGEPAEIFAASGSVKSIKVKVSNLEPFMNKTRFVCQINIEGRLTSVNAVGPYYSANAEGPFISCDQMDFSYTSRSPQASASLDVLWGDSNRLDNPSNIRVTIYKCEQLAPSCGACATKEMWTNFQCGWCASQHTCRKWSHPIPSCPDGSWLTNTSSLCPSVVSVTPSHQPVQTQLAQPSLDLVMENLGNVPEMLTCVYSSSRRSVAVNGTRTATGVSCNWAQLGPRLPDYQAFVAAHQEPEFTSKLSIETVDGKEVASTDFTVFDCSAFTSCTSCVSSRFQCNWCFDADVCTYDARMTCLNDTKYNMVITGISKIDPGINSGPTFCPAIRPKNSGLTEILVPSGSERNIQVNVEIKIEAIKKKYQFRCEITIEGKETQRPGRLNYSSNSLTCDAMQFNYTSQTPTQIAEIWVRTSRGKFLDNPEKIQIVMYKCNQMASHCAPCLKLDRKYQCGWCQASKTCEMVEECRTGDNRLDWVSGNQTCTIQRAPVG